MLVKITKIKRLKSPENKGVSSVSNGSSATGIYKTSKKGTFNFLESKCIEPVIGSPVLVVGRTWIRTSLVTSFYIKGSDNDKLILPKGFPIEEIGDLPEIEEGEMLLTTINSIYHIKALNE